MNDAHERGQCGMCSTYANVVVKLVSQNHILSPQAFYFLVSLSDPLRGSFRRSMQFYSFVTLILILEGTMIAPA